MDKSESGVLKFLKKKKWVSVVLILSFSFMFLFYCKDDLLFSSLRYDNLFFTKVFLELGANINKKDSYGNPLIYYAIISNNEKLVSFLIKNGTDLNSENNLGDSPLSTAILQGNIEIVKLLVENGAKRCRNSSGMTPILDATFTDSTDIAKYLFKYSEMTSSDKVNLIGHVFYNSNLELLKFFNENGVETTFKPLIVIVHKKTDEKKAIEMLKFLIRKGVNLNRKYHDGRTLLIGSAIWHKNKILEFLLKNGADKNVKDNEGNTALDWAKANKNNEGTLILKNWKVSSEDKDLSVPTSKRGNYPQQFDRSIINLKFHDPESFEKIIGKDYTLTDDDTEHMPHIYFYNKEKTEILTLFFHYGGVRSSFAEVRVTKGGEKIHNNIKILGANSFVTNKGVHLGISKKSLLKILGDQHTVEKRNELEIIKYFLNQENEKDQAFLKIYNMPEYYGRYIFKNNVLVEFQFGFTYP